MRGTNVHFVSTRNARNTVFYIILKNGVFYMLHNILVLAIALISNEVPFWTIFNVMYGHSFHSLKFMQIFVKKMGNVKLPSHHVLHYVIEMRSVP